MYEYVMYEYVMYEYVMYARNSGSDPRMSPELETFNPSHTVRMLQVTLKTYQGARRHRHKRPQHETSSHKNPKCDTVRVTLSDINTSPEQCFEKRNIAIRVKSPFIYSLPISLDDNQTQAYRFR